MINHSYIDTLAPPDDTLTGTGKPSGYAYKVRSSGLAD